MFTFRQKIFISYVIAFLVFLALMYPFASRTVKAIATKAMADRSNELIAKIQSAPNNDALIRRLKEQKSTVFFRVSVITNDHKVLYDSHTKRLLGPRFSQEYVVDHPEVLQAFEKGSGYSEDYSELLDQKFAYMAKAFDFHGKTYVIRTAFPYKYVIDLTHDCEMGFLLLATAVLLLFSTMTWFIIHRLTSPIQQIIDTVRPYQEGIQNSIPEIKLRPKGYADEFNTLAMTLNSLSEKIQKHINSLVEERNEKEAVLESLIEGVVAVDSNMCVTYANHMALKLIDMSAEELQGRSFMIAHQPKCHAILAACQQENQVLTETLTINKDGKKTYLDIVAVPKRGSGGAILVMQDKSTHYKLLEMRKDFIANASHELKTPITIIRGFAETLHDNPELARETTLLITEKIVKNCQRMTVLIKDLLTLSDIENIPESRLEVCDLVELIERGIETLEEIFPDAKIKIIRNPEDQFTLVADSSLMELAFMNIIENGLKYSKPPADIEIRLGKTKNGITISFSDKGIGIPPADLEHIFERFYTVDKAHSQKLGGSGLGLSIVQTIIHKHFGQISAVSEVDKGTTFIVFLPYPKENESK